MARVAQSGKEPHDPIGSIEEFLRQCVAEMEPAPAQPGPGRPRILPALALWAGLLVCVLRGFGTQLAIWRLLSDRGLWFFPRFPVTDQAVYKRLQTAGTAPLERLFGQISTVLATRVRGAVRIFGRGGALAEGWLRACEGRSVVSDVSALSHLLATRVRGAVSARLAPFAAEVVSLDESTLDAVARRLSTLRGVPAGDRRRLPGKLAGVFDIRRPQWRRVRLHPHPHQNAKVGARALVAGLPARTLVVADLGYFGFAWFDWLTERGYYWVSRLRAKTSYTVLHVFYQRGEVFDGLVWLGAHRADRARQAVRLVTFRQGGTLRRYITNVRAPHTFPLRAVAEVYARRWDIEMAFALVKQHLKLRLLWSAKPVVIHQQLWATLIIAQVLQALRLEIAAKAGVDPFEVSIGLLVAYAPRYAYEGRDPVQVFVERGRALGFIRPSRRTRIHAPPISSAAIRPAPPDLELIRPARYAHRKCVRQTPHPLQGN